MAPHNLGEVITGIIGLHWEKSWDYHSRNWWEVSSRPDFPNGGIDFTAINGWWRQAFETGKGRSSVVEKRTSKPKEGWKQGDDRHHRDSIHGQTRQYGGEKLPVDNEKKIEGISAIRERNQISIRNACGFMSLKRDAISSVVLIIFNKHTALQTSFFRHNVALKRSSLIRLNLKKIFKLFHLCKSPTWEWCQKNWRMSLRERQRKEPH